LRFTRLRLNGFKSFVDPTEMVIADGLTGIVGPNGCGKSNLLEALRWVMGENRASAMRGGGMEDVIFAGTARRPARNFAEVVLSIDNSERLAPAGFNDSDVLDIVRRITRDAGSAYKANTKDIRARDVQMLFADASTGAHSPALVRQGQISELINAKPTARRRILEEAAGISGLYQRRHEAELKLKGAETNLTRLDDVIEALAQQLQSLARQARQAARYREIGAQLRQAEGLLLYRRWREADEGRAVSEDALREQLRATAEAERLARAAAADRSAREEALPARREEAAIAAAILQRVEVERQALDDQEARARGAIRSLMARIEQMTRDLDREGQLNRDAGETIARLEAEAATIAAAGEGHEAALEAAAVAAREAARVLSEREEALTSLTEDVARLAARHHAAHRLRDDAKTTLEKSEAEAARARGAVDASAEALTRAGADAAAAQAAQEAAAAAAAAAEAALVVADDARGEAQGLEAEARAGRSGAEGELAALKAEVAALARLVNRDTAEGGQVLDLLRVRSGYEKALGAALADDLRAPALDGKGGSGWALLPGYASPQTLPEGVAALTAHVTVPEVLARRMAQVGLVDRADGARLQAALKPGQRLVSVEGDLWRWDGFRTRAEDAPSAAALRLQQLNRLEALKQELEEATARAEGAARAHEVLKARLAETTAADAAARDARRRADQAVTEAGRALSRAEADRDIAGGRLESLKLAVARHEDAAMEARQALRAAERAVADLEDLDAARAMAEDVKTTVEAARLTMIARRSAADELRREGEARERRGKELSRELSTWRDRLETAGERVAELEGRKGAAARELAQAEAQPAEIAGRRAKVDAARAEALARNSAAGDALAESETALRDAVAAEREAERRASEAREGRARAEARAEAAREAVAAAVARIDDELGVTPSDLLATLGADPDAMPSSDAIEADVQRLKRQREALGCGQPPRRGGRPRGADRTRHARVREGRSRGRDPRPAHRHRQPQPRGARAASDRLRAGEHELRATLHPSLRGRRGALVMVESDDPLEAGLEIMCQPPGKKLSTLSLLSGGEQTLTALALIFAVFLANPAPICVLDEVDAPLDDANVTRFCDMLDEMTRRTETRFLIITHHAVTMARMDRLFGVTMGEQGVSQLVSVDLRKAEQLVA
jgi:chromosome segregation protein